MDGGFNTVLCIILDPKDCLVMTNMSFLGNITLDWWAPFDQCKQWCLNTTSCYGIINESNKRCTTFRYDAESKNNLNTEDWENMQIMHKSKWCLKCGRKLWKRMVFLISVFIAEIDWTKSNSIHIFFNVALRKISLTACSFPDYAYQKVYSSKNLYLPIIFTNQSFICVYGIRKSKIFYGFF